VHRVDHDPRPRRVQPEYRSDELGNLPEREQGYVEGAVRGDLLQRDAPAVQDGDSEPLELARVELALYRARGYERHGPAFVAQDSDQVEQPLRAGVAHRLRDPVGRHED